MLEALSTPLFQRVLIAALLASVVSGVMGTYVVVKRMSSVTGGLAHAAFGGVGLGYLLGIDPLLGAAAFAVISAVGISIAYRRFQTTLDTSISMFWAGGMAFGVLCIALTPGYAPDLTSYLFGNILYVSWTYVWIIAALDVVILGSVALLYRPLEATLFDEEFSEVVGIPVTGLFMFMMVLVALTVVILIRIVGVILAIALLTIPAVTARRLRDTLGGIMGLATAIAAVCTTAGFAASYALSTNADLALPTGPLIIMIALAIYAGSFFVRAPRY